MSLFTGFAVYFIIWWVTLFVVLPWGVKSQAEAETVSQGTDPGAPVQPMLGRKLLINTLVAGVVFGAWYVSTYQLGFGLEALTSLLPQRP